jgi:predicted RNA polymerase sigma factor
VINPGSAGRRATPRNGRRLSCAVLDAIAALAADGAAVAGAQQPTVHLHRHKGQLLLRLGQSETAEESYRQALSIARDQEAKQWELRGA